ncbi:cellulose-binding protein, partial [Streptomyces geysiriensis]|nr:cellulose-binding protein [Streptomyces geysiriensis]
EDVSLRSERMTRVGPRAGAEEAAARDLDAHHAELLARAERELDEARRARAEAEEAAVRWQEEARTRASELIAGARDRRERIARETELVLHEHGERWDELQAHVDSVRSNLRSLTGRAAE